MGKPKIRFKGYQDDWEQRKVSEMFKVTRGYVLPATDTSQEITDEMPYPVYSSQTKDNGLMGYYSDYLYEDAITWTTDGANAGTVNFRAGKFYCTNVCGVLLSDKIETSKVIAEALNNVAKRYVSYVGNPKLMNNVMADIQIAVPTSKRERDQISSYFSCLDRLITLHQRKCEETKKLKKFMLQKMFPQNGSLVPEIRFDAFTDDWEQRKLNDYLNVSTAKNKDNHYGKEDVLSVSGDYGIVNQIEFQGRSFAGASVANYGVVNTGDVVYTKSPLSTNPYGIIKTNKRKSGIVSTLYAVYKPCKSVNPEFVQVYFELNSRMNNYMQPLVNKGAKNDMKVTAENALKGGVYFPELKEQDALVEYFRSLDHLITLHQQKCADLKNLKKYMLQNMFI